MAIRIPSASGIRAWLEPVVDLERLGAAWRALEAQSEASFFQSWGWIGCWLRHLGSDRQPLAAIAERNGQVVGLGVFVPGRERRHRIATARTLRLHESGEPALDSLYIEHNGLVAERAYLPQVWAAVVAVLTGSGRWDELAFGGLATGARQEPASRRRGRTSSTWSCASNAPAPISTSKGCAGAAGRSPTA